MKSILLLVLSIVISFAATYIFVKPPVKSSANANKIDKLQDTASSFSLEEAPNKSLRGKLAKIAGDVKIQTRKATEPAALSSETEIQQGEVLVTGEDGSLTVEFKNGARLRVSAESNVDFAQTLPEHIVIVQKEGNVRYQSAKNSVMSVRSMHLLADIAAGSDVTIEKDAELLNFTVKKGSVKMAFNDLENITTKIIVAEGETYVFNDDTREGEITN